MSRLLLAVTLLAACSTEPLNERTLTRYDMGEDARGGDPDTSSNDAELDVQADDAQWAADSGIPDLCQPNRDGSIERSEITLVPGLTARFATARDVSWDTRPDTGGGESHWDLAEEFPGESDVLVELRDPSGQWFGGTFPDADYFTTLGTGSDLLGIFRVTDDAVLLVGVATPEDGLFATELEYDPPVPVLQFPLEVGERWSVESRVSGLYQGVLSVYTETYGFEVDDSGTLLTPFGTFDVMRVRSRLDREVGVLTTVIRSFAFVTECFGTVATITSQENEDEVDFSEVSEVRRITP